MKQISLRSSVLYSRAFTLVELLVVIGIIAILAAAVLGIAPSVINSAKRAKMANLANQMQTAALSYYTEYNIYPIPTGQAASTDFIISDATGSSSTWAGMLYGLCGNINPYDASTTAPGAAVPNTRAIAFLNLKSSDVDKNNAPVNTLAPTATTNPYFNMAIDGDYSGVIGDATSAVNGKLPNFGKSTTTAMDYTGTSASGIAVWANCNGSVSITNPNFWVKTY